MKDKMSSLYIMPNKIKTIINSTWWMLFLAIIASLLHPLLYSAGIGFYMDCPSYFFLHILAYTILGNLIWNALKHKAWWIPALAITLGVNIILFVFLYFFVKSWDVRDALTVLVFLFDFGFSAVLSAIPIGVFCYKKQKRSIKQIE